MNKRNSGITLVALVITIIVLLILAGVSIALVIGDNGVLSKSQEAKAGSIVAEEREQVNLAYSSALTKKLGAAVTAENLQEELDESVGVGKTTVSVNDNVITVLFNETGNSYDVNGTTADEDETITQIHSWTRGTGENRNILTCSHCGVEYPIGSYVEYTPDIVETQSIVSGTDSGVLAGITDGLLNASNFEQDGAQKISQEELEWVVLGIQDTDKDGIYETLLITSKEPTEARLTLYGASAYNNGPDIMNTVCRELYSNNRENSKARSITIEDINNLINWTNTRGLYRDENEDLQSVPTGTLLSSLPSNIWNSVISMGTCTPDGINTESKLGSYELDGYYYLLNSAYNGTYIVNFEDTNDTSKTITQTEKLLIFPQRTGRWYWLASKSVNVEKDEDDYYVGFGPGFVNNNVKAVLSGTWETFTNCAPFGDVTQNLRPVIELTSLMPNIK